MGYSAVIKKRGVLVNPVFFLSKERYFRKLIFFRGLDLSTLSVEH
jgi:hypothetical protein